MSVSQKDDDDFSPPAKRHDVDNYLTIDHPFQLAMLRRVGAYALIGIVYFAAISLVTDSMAGSHRTWQSMWMKCSDEAVFWAPGLLFILPALAIDLLRLTGRFALPVNRVAEELRLLADGKSETPLGFDDCEVWEDLVRDFNELRDELLELRQANLLAKSAGNAFSTTVPLAAKSPSRHEQPGTVV